MAKRKKRTYVEMFLDTLAEMSHGGAQLVGNNILRERLGWEEERYNFIKNQLLSGQQIIVGRGQGGTVSLSNKESKDGIDVFISYSHADEDYKNKLLKHLEPLKRMKLIEAWHDRKIKAGEEWGKEISKNLENSQIILLLVSIDFINSEYCYDIELEKALEGHQKGNMTLIPIICRSCMWQDTPFGKFQALPKDGKALDLWPNLDEALTHVASELRAAVERIEQSK